MQILKSNLKSNELVVSVSNPEDFWYLSHIIEKDDLVKSRTLRKIKLGSSDDRSQKIVKLPLVLEVQVDTTDLTGSDLRVSGKITSDIEDIRKGSFHTITIELNSVITIKKQKWFKYQLDKLKESSLNPPKILIIALDRDHASFAVLKKYGYEYLTDIYGNVPKKAMKEEIKNTFYQDVIIQVKEYDSRYNFERIILASPAFWKEDLLKEIKEKSLSKKIVPATCYSTGKEGINEILKRDEIKSILNEQRAVEETLLVEDLFHEIAKNNLATYGISHVMKAAIAGAIKDLLVSDSAIKKFKDENNYAQLDDIMSSVENSSGKVHIISSEHEAGKRLNGLNGIAAILRYKLYY